MAILPRSPLALGTLAACLVAVLLGSAVLIATGHGPAPAAASIGGPFALVDQDGRPVTDASLAGHPAVVFFGYTHCPDVCPTALSDMSRLMEALGPAAKDVKAVFITTDPDRDTPAVLKSYLSSFNDSIVGLTGTPEAVTAAEKAYKVYARKVPGKDGDYSMDHTAVVYLMDRQGRFVEALNLDGDLDGAAADIRRQL